MFHVKLHAAVHAAEGCRVTAGDEYLPVMDMIENIILPGRVELTHHIVQKRNRLYPRDVPEQGRLGELQSKNRRALLSL